MCFICHLHVLFVEMSLAHFLIKLFLSLNSGIFLGACMCVYAHVRVFYFFVGAGDPYVCFIGPSSLCNFQILPFDL